jgi:HAE1 family hydrophobic/amphiphilic exporter-1
MSISELFIKRPVMTTLVMAGILLFGLVSYRNLAVSDLPTVDYPTVSVNASLPGASPETMASSVATPLEKQFSTIAGIDAMTSQSALGSTSITLQFALDRNIDAAAADVQAAISQTLRTLPQNIVPPSYQKVDPSSAPILYFALTLDGAAALTARRIRRDVSRAAHLHGDGRRAGAGVRLAEVRGAHPARPAGDGHAQDWHRRGRRRGEHGQRQPSDGRALGHRQGVHGAGQRPALEREGLRPLIVAYKNGAPVRLQDIGTVVDGVQNRQGRELVQRQRAIVLAVSGSRAPTRWRWRSSSRRRCSQMESQLPGSVTVHDALRQVAHDRGIGHRREVHALLTLFLVVLVIFLFLRNISATIIPSLALPMSLVGTFAVMYMLDYSLDNLSLMALTLSVGFVVDDAIVMLENIVRHIEMGEPCSKCSRDRRLARDRLHDSLDDALARCGVHPRALPRRPRRPTLHEFAVTIGVSIMVSGFVSLTLTPMLCSRFLKPQHWRSTSARCAG